MNSFTIDRLIPSYYSRQINNQSKRKQIYLQSRIVGPLKHLPNSLGLLETGFYPSIYKSNYLSIYLQGRIVCPLKAFPKQLRSLIQIDRYIYRQIDILTEQDCRFSQSIYQTAWVSQKLVSEQADFLSQTLLYLGSPSRQIDRQIVRQIDRQIQIYHQIASWIYITGGLSIIDSSLSWFSFY